MDQARHVEVVAPAPGMIQDIRQQDVLPAGDRVDDDAQKRQQAGDGRRNPLAVGFGLADQTRRRGFERAKHGQRQPGGASRRVDRQVDRVAEPRDPRAILAPGSQPLAPLLGRLGGELLESESLPPCLVRIDPREEVLGTQLGKAQEQVAQVSLGIDRDHRDAVDRRLFQQGDSQPGLAAAGHPHANGVRGQVLRLVEQQVRRDLALLQVIGLAEVKKPELFVVLHGFPGPVEPVLE